MHKEIINGKECFIGRGEDIVYYLIQKILPNGEYKQQVNLSDLVEIPQGFSRHLKETIDIFVTYKKQRIAIRLQNKKGSLKMLAESNQKDLLKRAGYLVVDIDENQSPNVFAEKQNYLTLLEIVYPLFKVGVKP